MEHPKWASKTEAAKRKGFTRRRLQQLAKNGKFTADPQGKGRVLWAEVSALKRDNRGRKVGQTGRLSIPWADQLRINQVGQISLGAIPIIVAGKNGCHDRLCGIPQQYECAEVNMSDAERAARVLAVRMFANLLTQPRRQDLDTGYLAGKFIRWRNGLFFERPKPLPMHPLAMEKKLDALFPDHSARQILVIAAFFLRDSLLWKKPRAPRFGFTKSERANARRKLGLVRLFSDKTVTRTPEEILLGAPNPPVTERQRALNQCKARLLAESKEERRARTSLRLSEAHASLAQGDPGEYGHERALLLLKGVKDPGATKTSRRNIGTKTTTHGYTLDVLLGISRPRASQLRQGLVEDYKIAKPKLRHLFDLKSMQVKTRAEILNLLLAEEQNLAPDVVGELDVEAVEDALRWLQSEKKHAEYQIARERYDRYSPALDSVHDPENNE